MKTKGLVDILLCFTPFVSDERDSKWVKTGNCIMNYLLALIFIISLLSIILHGNSIWFIILVFLAFIGAGSLIQVFRPIIKAKIGRKEGEHITDETGIVFTDDGIAHEVLACIKEIEDSSLDASNGMGLVKALIKSGFLAKKYSEGDVAWWLYQHYSQKYIQEYAESSIRRPSNPSIYVGRWEQKFQKFHELKEPKKK